MYAKWTSCAPHQIDVLWSDLFALLKIQRIPLSHVCMHTHSSSSSQHRHFLCVLDAVFGVTVYKPKYCVCPALKQEIQPGGGRRQERVR